MTDFWDQPRIAAEFTVAINTVQSSWRNATLQAVEAHLRAHGVDPATLPFGVKAMTRQRFTALRAEHPALKPLKLPDAALPLPDTMIGTKPGWRERTIRAWAADTGRHDPATGRLGRSSPPGRPAGIVEAGPRRRGGNARPAAAADPVTAGA